MSIQRMSMHRRPRCAVAMTATQRRREIAVRYRAVLRFATLAITAFLASAAQLASAQIIFSENFDSLVLGPFESATETNGDGTDWTGTPPAGWMVDNSTHTPGTLEFNGWTFLDPVSWNATAGQDRDQFTRGQNVIAVADPDEWDDDGSPSTVGPFNSFLKTPPIPLAGQQPGSLNLQFDSSWRPFDDQTGTVTVSYDGGAAIELVHLDISVPDDLNGSILVPLNNPAGATSAVISFGLTMARNDWWWAIDNIEVLVGDPVLGLTVNRDTGAVTMTNGTTGPVNISGYEITSAFEALAPDNWKSIAENYDANSGGSVDGTNVWTELTDPTAHGDLSEADLASGNGTTIAAAQSVNLGNANAWIRNPTEDLVFQYVSNGVVLNGLVDFIGNGGEAFIEGDFNLDGDINVADWTILRSNQHTDFTGKSLAEAYRLGDLNGDLANNHPDFAAFKTIYEAANGAGTFAAMIAAQVPEPSTLLLLCLAAGIFAPSLSRASTTR